MVELKDLQSKSDFVASSSTYSCDDIQILRVLEASLIVVKSEGRVSLVCTKTNRSVGSLFKNEKVFCVWLKKSKVSLLLPYFVSISCKYFRS
jgi:hypothetical protein